MGCQRCGKPICPDCMRPASVGFHCPDCAKSGSQKVLSGRQVFGGAAAGAYPVTMALIAVNVAVLIAEYVLRQRGTIDLFNEGALFELASAPARNGDRVLRGVAEGEWWRIVTSGFLHSGPIHLAFNCYALWVLGRSLEAVLGNVRYLLVYGVSMLCGSLGVLVAGPPNAPTVGASGAVFGLVGVLVALQLAKGQSVWRSNLGQMLVINLIITFTIPRISIGGHLGGLVGGLACGFILFGLPKKFTGLRATSEAAPVLLLVGALAIVGCVLVV